MRIKVYEDWTEKWMPPGQRSWAMWCEYHGASMTSSDWEGAYEAALGHACMRHSR